MVSSIVHPGTCSSLYRARSAILSCNIIVIVQPHEESNVLKKSAALKLGIKRFKEKCSIEIRNQKF